jgi:hypothetical protein
MHLGFIDRPLLPLKLVSAQESPVPLTKFEMVPRLKILVSYGSKKGTQIHYPFLSRKSQQENPFPVPHWDPYGEIYLLTGNFYVSRDISLYLKGPIKRASLHVTQKRFSTNIFTTTFGAKETDFVDVVSGFHMINTLNSDCLPMQHPTGSSWKHSTFSVRCELNCYV